MMKFILYFICLAFFSACASTSSDKTDEFPTDVTALRQLEKQRKDELNLLQQEIDRIEGALAKADPNYQDANLSLVTTIPVAIKDFERLVAIQGNVESNDVAHVSSETGGRLIEMKIIEGQFVRKGQHIAKVDMETLDRQIEEVDKSLELANDIYARQSRLWQQEIGSEIQYLQAKNNKERLEKSLETLKSQLVKQNIYAPISGEVNMVLIESGEMAMPGAPIAEIINTRNLKVVIDVPESYLGVVKRGQYVLVRFPSLGLEQKAYVSRISSTIDVSNRTFGVEANVRNSDGLLKPNLLTEMLVPDYKEENVIVVPINLVQQEVGGKYFVYVLSDNDGSFFAKKVYVDIGESHESEIVITTGLTGEETLIDKGARSLSEGEQLEIVNDISSANG